MFTLATQEVNGAELVTEAVVSILNPNVIAKASINHYGVHHLQVTSVVVDDTLTPADVRIEPRLRDARVNTHRRDGTAVHRTYDSAGNITQEQVTGSAVPPADETAHLVPRDSLRWRIAVPAAAAVAAVGACVMLAFVARRR
jgi:acyl CoA:acetate/3-ketoacid CoA transferase